MKSENVVEVVFGVRQLAVVSQKKFVRLSCRMRRSKKMCDSKLRACKIQKNLESF